MSVCVCTFNGAAVVGRAIESVLAQGFSDFELLVLDDASADDTVEVLNAYGDDRIRIVRNDINLGNARNRSKALRYAVGEFVQFVDQDDWIEPACLAEHVALLKRSDRLGFTFSRRYVALEDEASEAARAWRSVFADVHVAFRPLCESNKGSAMLAQYIDAGLPGNWIGEPTSVMLRRECLARSGLFNRRLIQTLDVDLWIRLMASFDVGFLDARLATRWVGSSNETVMNRTRRRDWLDRLWMFEGLREMPALWHAYPQLHAMYRTEQKSLVVSMLTGRHRPAHVRDALADARAYTRHRLLAAARHAPPLLEHLNAP